MTQEDFINTFSLHPYGAKLRSDAARNYLNSGTIMVGIMALVEAIAWANLGYRFGTSWDRWLIGGFVAAIVFVVIWIIDRMLITMDFAASEHRVRLYGASAESAHVVRSRKWATLAVRVALMAGSLTISAPYLALAIFHTDVEQLASQQAGATLFQAREKLAASLESGITKKSGELASKRNEYESEAAGKGLTGRIGLGPAAQAKHQAVKALQGELAQLTAARDSALAEFDRLSQDWRANRQILGERYQAELPKAGVLQDRSALQELEKKPENRQVEMAIKTFLAFIFLALILLKLFEPDSVRLYLSDLLQQEFQRYASGTFDQHLLPGERSTGVSYNMTAQRFYSFLVSTWLPVQQSEEELREAAKRKRKLEETREEREQHYEAARARVRFEEDQRHIEEQRREEKQRAEREEARRLERLAISECLDASQRRIANSQQALARLTEQEPRIQHDLIDAEEQLREASQDAQAADGSLSDLRATITIVEQDIAYFDGELAKYDAQKKSLDEKGAADFTLIQVRLRAKRGDANQGLASLKQSLAREEKSCAKSEVHLKEAQEHHRTILQRRDALRSEIEKIEKCIAQEALDAGTSILEQQAATEAQESSRSFRASAA